MADQPSEYAVVIRRGPKCAISPDTSHMLPTTIRPTFEEADKVRAWYQQVLSCDFPEYVRHCRYVVVELREVP